MLTKDVVVSRQFCGFEPEQQGQIAIPSQFFDEVAPLVSDISELQVSLAFFRLLQRAGGAAKPIAETALLADPQLRQALRVSGSPNEPDRRILTGLDLATGRSTLLKVLVGEGPTASVWYYLNTAGNRHQIGAMARGAAAAPDEFLQDGSSPSVQVERPTI